MTGAAFSFSGSKQRGKRIFFFFYCNSERMVLATIISQVPLEDTVRSLDKQSVIIVVIIISIWGELRRDLRSSSNTCTDISVHHSRREAAAGPFSLSNELYEFYLYYYSIADEKSGWSPTHNTLLLCLIQVFDAITEWNYRFACRSALCFRRAEISCPVSHPAK